jgi:hypothetical protein
MPELQDNLPTREESAKLAGMKVRETFDNVPHIGHEAVLKAYRRVACGVKNPGSYHLAPTGFQERYRDALRRVADTWRRRLAAKRAERKG